MGRRPNMAEVVAEKPALSNQILEVEGLCAHHGQLLALDGVSFTVGEGSVFAVIGANGAGKSTLMRSIAGLHRPSEGRVIFDGTDITRLSTPQRVELGISLVPEGRRLFASLSVEENLQTGTYIRRSGQWTIERVYEMFPWMWQRKNQRSSLLSGGEQQTVAISRALLANPRLLLIDELSLGLAPIVVRSIYGSLSKIMEGGLTVLIVEQDVNQALSVAAKFQCMLEGRTTLSGKPAEFTPEEIEAAYFGLNSTSSIHGKD